MARGSKSATTDIEAVSSIGEDHETAARRNPHRIRTEAAIIAIPTVMKPNVTTVSCQGRALWPAPVIGERLAAPIPAANVVMAQLTYVPYSVLQYAPAFRRGESLTSIQTAPNATRKIPFMTPSRCAASPIRGLLNCCSTNPVSKPNKNRNIPCQSKERWPSAMLIIVSPMLFPESVRAADLARPWALKRNPGRLPLWHRERTLLGHPSVS